MTPTGAAPPPHDPVAERADVLWRRRHGLDDAERTEALALPAPYGEAFRADGLRRAGRREEGLVVATDALVLAAPTEPFRGHLLLLQANILCGLNLTDQAVEANHKAQDLARARGDDAALAGCLQDLATYAHQTPDSRRALLDEARRLAQRAGASDVLVVIDFNRAWWSMESGAPADEVIAAFADVERRARTVWPDLAVESRGWSAQTAARAGRIDLARQLITGLPPLEEIDDEETRSSLAGARAWVLADEGQVDEAARLLREALPLVGPDVRLDLLTVLSDVLAHAGRYEDAWRASRELVDATRTTADGMRTSQARALEVWYRTRLAQDATRREQARADNLEAALARLSAAHEQIRELSRRDQLTGLHNRRYLMEVGEEAMALAGPDTPVQVALADIDGFKAINDSYGHRTGDLVLATIGRIIRETLDPEDLAARYGGEEFVVLRPAGVRPGSDLATELCAISSRLAAETFGAAPGEGPTGVTMSGGLVRARAGTLEEALHVADLRMYDAKRAGGDRLVREP